MPEVASVDQILRPDALGHLDAAGQLRVWCAYHGTGLVRLAEELGVDASQLSRVVRGRVKSARLVEAIRKRTGVQLA